MENRYTITLSQSDKLIASWRRKVITVKKGLMSMLVRNAVLTFIETGEFLDIGHIHFHPEEITVEKTDIIILQTARNPVIKDWIEANIEAGLGVSEPIKLLLKECIKTVPDTEQEYFPSAHESALCDRISILNTMRANANKVTGKTLTPIEEKKPGVTAPITKKEPVEEKRPAIQTLPPHQNDGAEEEISQAVLSGLAGLYPQRATRKK